MVVLIAVIAFFCGAYAVISQSYLAREFLVVFLGNEMSLAVLLAGWLAGVAGGARIARARAFARRGAYALSLCLAAWVVLLPVAVLAVRMSRSILGVPVGNLAPLSSIVIAACGFVGVFSALGGFAFVTLCRLAAGYSRRVNPVGLVYVAEAAGSVAGGTAFTFWLAGRYGPFSAALAAYAAMGILTVSLAAAAARRGALTKGGAVTVTIGAAVLAAAGAALLLGGRDAVVDRNSAAARMATIAQGFVVDSRETRYQNLTTVMLAGQYTTFGNGEALMTFPEPLLEEQEAYTVLTEHGAPGSVLVIGGGPSFLEAVLDYGVESVDYVELDPAVVAVYRTLVREGKLPASDAAVLDSDRVKVHYGDARAFVSEAAARGALYDVIIIRMPDPRTLFLNRLYTVEFMREAKAALKPGGVLTLYATLAEGYLSGEVGQYAGAVYRTAHEVFRDILVTPDVRATFLACDEEGVLTSSPEKLSARFAARGLQSQLFPALFAAVFPEERTAAVNEALAALPGGPANSDWSPTTYEANLVLWSRFSNSPVAGWILAAAGAGKLRLALFVIVAALACAAWALIRRRMPSAAGIAVAYTGVTSMSMTVILIYVFQVECGYVYNWIGVLAAAFLGGLAVGGAAGSAARGGRPKLLAAEAMALLVPLAAIAALYAASQGLGAEGARYVILALAAVSGFAGGFEFPVAAAVLGKAGASPGEAASRLQVRDQAGACAGALVAGIVIVPAIGIWWSLALLAAVKAVSAAAVAFSTDRVKAPVA
jgi:spermidine synthase